MPRISISELNATVSTPMETTDAQPVAIIGTAIKGPYGNSATTMSPIMCGTIAEFQTAFGDTVPTYNPYGYIAAYEAIHRGNPVLYTRIVETGGANAIDTATIEVAGTNVSPVDTLLISFNEPGAVGNAYSVVIGNVASQAYPYTVYRGSTAVFTGTFPATIPSSSTASNVVATNDYVTITYIMTNETTYTWVDGNVPKSGTYVLTGGNNGDNMSDASIYTQIGYALQQLQDDTIWDFTTVCAPALSEVASGSNYVWQLFVDFCGDNGTALTSTTFLGRTDVTYILDCLQTSSYTTVLSDLGMIEVGDPATDLTFAHGALFFPWFRYTTYANSTSMFLPPSIFYIMAMASAQSSGIPCEAVAGPYNSAIERVSELGSNVGSVVSAYLNNICVNPIVYHRTFGFFLDGNNVLNPAATNNTYRQLSIRKTINYINKYLRGLCYAMSYRANTNITRNEFQGKASSFLDQLKTAGFVYGYQISLQDSDTDQADGVITATVRIYPTPSIESFVLNLQIVNLESLL